MHDDAQTTKADFGARASTIYKKNRRHSMLLRNIIEIAIVVVLIIATVLYYRYAKSLENDLESNMTIRTKSEIQENIEGETLTRQ